MEEKFVTVVGFKNYYGTKPFGIGNLVICTKEPDNEYDPEAIKVTFPALGKIGYLANSPETVAGVTMSAGRIYDKVERVFIARVMFSTGTKVICKVEPILFVTDKKDISLSEAIIDYVLHESRKKLADSMEIIEYIDPKEVPDWKISDR